MIEKNPFPVFPSKKRGSVYEWWWYGGMVWYHSLWNSSGEYMLVRFSIRERKKKTFFFSGGGSTIPLV
jgi:hypothetical protein